MAVLFCVFDRSLSVQKLVLGFTR